MIQHSSSLRHPKRKTSNISLFVLVVGFVSLLCASCYILFGIVRGGGGTTAGRGGRVRQAITNNFHRSKNNYSRPTTSTLRIRDITSSSSSLTDIRRANGGRGQQVHPIPPLTPLEEYNAEDFFSVEEEESFLIPKYLKSGEMEPIRWRDDLTPVDGEHCKAFVVGLPEELQLEVQSYMGANGMLEYARTMIYEERPPQGGHRIYTLNDGRKWASQLTSKWKTDMVWFDPADEETFESLVAMLKKGGFGQVLDSIGRAFDLNGIMIQGIGAIFLSQYEQSKNMHVDMDGMPGTFFNILFPIHIPENDTGKLYIGDYYNKERHPKATVNLRYDSAIVIGGETLHGTGECDYRDKRDLRLLLNVYIADIESEDGLDRISKDSTSLWPTYGDKNWFFSQKHRFYSRDGSTSMEFDQGRKPLHIMDEDEERCPEMEYLCEDDPDGWRLKCPKTCKVYQEDDEYYNNILMLQQQHELSTNDSPTATKLFWEILVMMIFILPVVYVFYELFHSRILSNKSKVHSH